MKQQCEICPHHCLLAEGQKGLCRGRMNIGGKIVCQNYGKLTALVVDPIEKKPLYHFYPGSKILSVGSYGCNLNCRFCQNSGISMADENGLDVLQITPEELVDKALMLKKRGNIGIAYTYNEPLIGYEFVKDCANIAKQAGLKNVVVTNGYIEKEPLNKLLPLIDAFNIDLKGFTECYYQKLGGDLATVKHSISLVAEKCHVEVTTLIIPEDNDSEAEIIALSQWIASINPEIPLHLSRFFPRWKMQDRVATPVEQVFALAKLARRYLKYVYEGNC